MKKYKYIFVVLVYRVAKDLFDFDKSLKEYVKSDYKVVIINSYMNEKTEKEIRETAFLLKYDYLNVENKGYGYGNNQGIKYVNENYEYDYLIISNADIIIKKFEDYLLPNTNAVIGPLITTINGKSQNPYWVLKNNLAEKWIYDGYKNASKFKMILAKGINKLIREVFLLTKKKSRKIFNIYAVHGSFLIFTNDVVKKLNPIYDEKMFLYNEEAYLAKYLKDNNVNCFFYPSIEILHKEDGSTSGIKFDENKYLKESYLYYYEKYILKN